jgi:hypothetical protein
MTHLGLLWTEADASGRRLGRGVAPFTAREPVV